MSKVASKRKGQAAVIHKENGAVDYIFILLISVLLIIAPFYRGLFFRENYIPFIAVTCGIFIVYLINCLIRRQSNYTLSYMDIAIMLLPVAYLFSFFVSVNMKNAFDYILKYASYLMLFYMVSRLSKGEGKKNLFIGAILTSLFLVSITGMLTMAGHLQLKGVTEYNRLYGLYQYPNTTGSMLGAGILICIGMLGQSDKKLVNIPLQIVLSTIFAGFIMTLSLGSFLVFGFAALVYFIIVSIRSKLNQISIYIITVLSGLPVLLSYFRGTLSNSFILSYVISIVLAVGLQYLYSYINNRYLKSLSDRTNLIIVLLIIILVVAALVAAFTIEGIIPKSIIDRIWNEELKIGNASDRLIYAKDAARIFKDNFVLGAGGGAWQDIYFKYQSFPYNSTEAHNYYMQLAVETGIVGVVILAAILIILTVKFIKALKSNREGLSIPIYFAIYMILGHALLDFDLSLAAPMYLLWSLIGLVSVSGKDKEVVSFKRVYPVYIMIAISAVILYLSTVTYAGISNGNNAAKLINSDINKAASIYSKAMSQDKFNGALRIDYAQIMYNKFMETKNEEYLNKMDKALDEIEKYEPYNWKYKSVVISLLTYAGRFDEAVQMADTMVKMKPLTEDVYIFKGQVNLQIADYYYKNNIYDESLKYLDVVIGSSKEWEEASAKSIKSIKSSDQIKQLAEQAQALKEIIESSNNQ